MERHGFRSQVHHRKPKPADAAPHPARQRQPLERPRRHRARLRPAEGTDGALHPHNRHRPRPDEDRPRNLTYNIRRLPSQAQRSNGMSHRPREEAFTGRRIKAAHDPMAMSRQHHTCLKPVGRGVQLPS
jgi:hypothetical protein